MNAPEETRWLDRLRAQLDEEVRDLDAATASRLNRARQAALDAGLAQRKARLPLLPYALAASIAAVLALAVTTRTPEPTQALPVATTPSTVDDLDLLASSEELEMIENLEFYAWLELQSLDG